MQQIRVALLMTAVQFVSYANLTVNFRAIAAGHVPHAMVTDAAASAISFFIIRKVSKSEGYAALAGMMVGGSLAAAFGIYMTRGW